MKESERAWLAGLYEGEGCCSIRKSSRSVSIIISMTDKDVIQRVQEIFGSGNITTSTRENRKKSYQWSVGKRNEVEKFIASTIEFLGKRRTDKFKDALEIYVYRDKDKKVYKGDLANNHKIKHGTISGSTQHYYYDIEPCVACRKAAKDYNKNKYKEHKVTLQEN